MLKSLKNFILDTLFPIQCLSCQEAGTWICEKCFSRIKISASQVCPYCEKIETAAGTICPACQIRFLKKNEAWPLDSLLVSTSYKDPFIPPLIHIYKYNFVSALAPDLGKIIIAAILKNNLTLPDIIIPVPLHKRRQRWRGFNQAELLANYISENLSPGFVIPVYSKLLRRKKYTPPQMKIKDYQERQKNISDAFGLVNPNGEKDILKNKTIFLIDDVATTGSTLFEASRVLRAAGAMRIFAAVIARQEYSK